MQLTIGTDANGNLNKSDIMYNDVHEEYRWDWGKVSQHKLFFHHAGLSFDLQSRGTAVETLFAAFFALMYIDLSHSGPLLEPLFRLQASRNYTIGYAAADLGAFHVNMNTEI